METVKDISAILGLIVSVSTVLGIFTAIVNKSFAKKLKPIEYKIEKHRVANLRADMEEWRYQVVSFASELRKGISKSKYEYEAIFTFMDEYEKAVEELGLNNGLFSLESQYIKESYLMLKHND